MTALTIEPGSRGDPVSPLRWTCLSVRQLATTLTKQGHPVSPQKVAQMLHEAGYSLQGTQKTLEGTTHPDRDAQFRHIADKVTEMQREAEPVISVDTKKKELCGVIARNGVRASARRLTAMQLNPIPENVAGTGPRGPKAERDA